MRTGVGHEIERYCPLEGALGNRLSGTAFFGSPGPTENLAGLGPMIFSGCRRLFILETHHPNIIQFFIFISVRHERNLCNTKILNFSQPM